MACVCEYNERTGTENPCPKHISTNSIVTLSNMRVQGALTPDYRFRQHIYRRIFMCWPLKNTNTVTLHNELYIMAS